MFVSSPALATVYLSPSRRGPQEQGYRASEVDGYACGLSFNASLQALRTALCRNHAVTNLPSTTEVLSVMGTLARQVVIVIETSAIAIAVITKQFVRSYEGNGPSAVFGVVARERVSEKSVMAWCESLLGNDGERWRASRGRRERKEREEGWYWWRDAESYIL